MKKNILIVYYTRTGYTEKIVNQLTQKIEADIEIIDDNKDRSGIIGYIKSAYDNIKKDRPKIKELKYKPADYEFIVIATPVWVSKMAAPIRSFVYKYKNDINKAVFITSQKGPVMQKVFDDMRKVLTKKEEFSIGFREKELDNNIYQKKIDKIIKNISS